jgi:CMP-N-acetylneuraminic acid synthetase
MRVLGLVPARGGSKGVPRKNIRPLGGKPLLAWTAEAALASRRLSRVVLSTDDEEIAEVGRGVGLEVPFLRPAELASDTAPTLPAVRHAILALEALGDRFDAVCLLQPTSPFRTTETIDGCIDLFEHSGADSLVTTLRVPAEYNPHWVYFARGDRELYLATGEAMPVPRRQDLPPASHREGSVYVTRRDVVIEHGSLYGARLIGYEVDPARAINIDTLDDWARAEQLLPMMS